MRKLLFLLFVVVILVACSEKDVPKDFDLPPCHKIEQLYWYEDDKRVKTQTNCPIPEDQIGTCRIVYEWRKTRSYDREEYTIVYDCGVSRQESHQEETVAPPKEEPMPECLWGEEKWRYGPSPFALKKDYKECVGEKP